MWKALSFCISWFLQLVQLHNNGKDGKEQCCHEEGASQWGTYPLQRGSGYVSAGVEGFSGALATELEVCGELPSQKNSFLFLCENKYT